MSDVMVVDKSRGRHVPGYRARGSKAMGMVSKQANKQKTLRKLTSQQELAIWQPAWPTMRALLAKQRFGLKKEMR